MLFGKNLTPLHGKKAPTFGTRTVSGQEVKCDSKIAPTYLPTSASVEMQTTEHSFCILEVEGRALPIFATTFLHPWEEEGFDRLCIGEIQHAIAPNDDIPGKGYLEMRGRGRGLAQEIGKRGRELGGWDLEI